ncbi:hypothetical protein D4Q80_00085 [bacterium]|nr:MAG: hypothetical protein D4Q80_00085 [bacterium]
MDTKKIRLSLTRYLGWLGLNFAALLVSVLPRSWVYGFAQNASRLGYRIAAKQRRTALENLSIAFGDKKTREEIEQIAKDSFIFMAKGGMEMMYFLNKPALLKKRVQMAGQDNLDAALSQGKGVILVSAHLGNFPLMMLKLSLQGYKIAGIMRPMRDERAEKMFLGARTRFGIKTIYSQPRRACVEETIRSLRGKEIVFIPIDQNFGSGGVFVDFFGKKAATATGPVVLAQRTGAPILPCFILRQKDDTHKIIFEPPFNLVEGKTQGDSVQINIQKLTDIIESYIRRYPAEWSWIHRRWKSRPDSENIEGGG